MQQHLWCSINSMSILVEYLVFLRRTNYQEREVAGRAPKQIFSFNFLIHYLHLSLMFLSFSCHNQVFVQVFQQPITCLKTTLSYLFLPLTRSASFLSQDQSLPPLKNLKYPSLDPSFCSNSPISCPVSHFLWLSKLLEWEAYSQIVSYSIHHSFLNPLQSTFILVIVPRQPLLQLSVLTFG